MSSNWNPGNFANRPQEEVENLASKGGQHSHQGGFASMDPSKQVFTLPSVPFRCSVSVLGAANICHQQNIASKGGKMSGDKQQQQGDQGITEFGQRRSSKYHYVSDDLIQPEE